MHAVLSRQLTVVIQRRMKRHVAISHVVADDGGEELDVAGAKGTTAFLGLEGATEVPGDLRRSPGQEAILVERLHAELRHGRVIVARQLGERKFAIRIDVDEVPWRL